MITNSSFIGATRTAWVLLAFIFMTAFTQNAFAQPETAPDSTASKPDKIEKPIKGDTTEIEFKNKKFVIITDKEGKKVTIEDVRKPKDQAASEDEDIEWESDENDTEYNPDYDNKSDNKRKRSEVDLLAFDFGFTNFYRDGKFGADAASPSLELKTFRPGSHVALHFLPTRVSLIGRGAVNLKSALTIDWTNLYFTNPITIQRGMDSLTIVTDNNRTYEKNKLMMRYFQIPLLLNFNTSPGDDEGLSLSVGGYAGLLWGARTRQESSDLGTVKYNDDFNLNPFKYGLTARIDFKWFDFYANYNLSDVFDDNSLPKTNTFNVGVNFINF